MAMQWKKLLSARRLGCARSAGVQQGRSPFQQDFDRIVFSSSFRLLHDKAQVFPLSDEDHVRTRLTHSIETASIGRSLGAIAGVGICKKLGESDIRPNHIGEIVAAASLAHDIGNPPFGHSGEESIRYWFTHSPVAAELRRQMSADEIADIDLYEGNAQGFRVLSRLEMPENYGGMQLTCATLGAVAKYPVTASAKVRPAGVAGKKFNFFQSDKALFDEVAATCGLLPVGCCGEGYGRHPLAFLVEAADDVTYRIVDFEDGHLLKIIEYWELENLMLRIIGDTGETRERLKLIPNERRRVEMLRAMTLGALVKQLTKTFLDYEDVMLAGELEKPLIDLIPAGKILAEIYDISVEKIYTYRRATEIGVAGYELTSGLLDVLVSAVEEYIDAIKRNEKPEPRSRRLMGLLPAGCCEPENPEWMQSAYCRVQRLLDYFTSMTDTNAVSTFKKIKGISLPGMLF
ncbi:MAG: dNTP triphosphohydrolase [Lentisphaeria bacterium]|nr:dNTP triphosphohydrolase [Lentisphaeria bacterium]